MSKELTCKDCKHFVNMYPSQSWCKRTGSPCGEICEWFDGDDGERTRFHRLTYRVDNMAEEMVIGCVTCGGNPGYRFIKSAYIFADKKDAIADAKHWLMEVVK